MRVEGRLAAGAALVLFCAAGCAQQDAALLVTLTGQYRIPADGDRLVIDVFDGTQEIKRASWCATAAPGCEALPAMPSLSASVTLVQSGAGLPLVKINAVLYLGAAAVVGKGTATASFQGGKTSDIAIVLTP